MNQFLGRFLKFTLGFSLLAPVPMALALTPPAETDASSLENAKFHFLGKVTGNNVYVRSGPSESDSYYTMRLQKDAEVTIVGMKFNFLKIVPPDGSFSYVAKLYVDRYGDGKTGRVTRDDLPVWAGSSLVEMKSARQCTLAKGTDVKIIGEAEEYYKIVPPAGAYLWVNRNFVQKVRMIEPEQPKTVEEVAHNTNQVAGPTTNPNDQTVAIADPVVTGDVQTPTTGPTTMEAAVPTTGPANTVASAEAEFDRLEGLFKTAEDQKLEERPVADVQGGYELLLKSDYLPSSMRQIATSRVATLKVWADRKAQLVALLQHQDEVDSKVRPLKAEEVELVQHLSDMGVQNFSALGVVRASSLQTGHGVLYRLTDPATDRTVCYVRSGDDTLSKQAGLFIGVHGPIVTDPQLQIKIVNVTDIQSVDINRVNKGITATLVPVSLKTQPEAKTDINP